MSSQGCVTVTSTAHSACVRPTCKFLRLNILLVQDAEVLLFVFVQGSAQGRFWSYSPTTGKTQMLADNIWQANGVALAHDESFVLVASTGSMRLYRYWLKGNKVRPPSQSSQAAGPMLALHKVEGPRSICSAVLSFTLCCMPASTMLHQPD